MQLQKIESYFRLPPVGPGSLVKKAWLERDTTQPAAVQELFELARNGVNFADGRPVVGEIQEHAGSCQAIGAVYRLGEMADDEEEGEEERFSFLLSRLREVQASKHRYIEIQDVILRAAIEEDRRTFLEIAAGSADALLEAAHFLKQKRGIKITLILTDADRSALESAQARAQELGVGDQVRVEVVRVLRGSLLNCKHGDLFRHLFEKYQPGMVEVVGLFDYFNKKKMETALADLKKLMKPGCKLIWSNVLGTEESNQGIIHHKNVFGWPEMTYRSCDEMQRLTEGSGLTNVKTWKDPLEFHGFCTGFRQ